MFSPKFYYCKRCNINMVNARNDGRINKYCRDCMTDWMEEQMMKDEKYAVPPGEQEAR